MPMQYPIDYSFAQHIIHLRNKAVKDGIDNLDKPGHMKYTHFVEAYDQILQLAGINFG